MVDQVTDISRSGFLGNMGKSIAMVPIGILLFLGSFALIWFTSGRANYAKIVVAAEAVAADTAGGHDGAFVAVTGPIGSPGTLGDPQFLAPGEYLQLERVAEMFAWVEDSDSDTRNKVGGGTETVTTYTYKTEWTASPSDASKFREPTGHANPLMKVPGQIFTADQGTVGAWMFSAREIGLPSARDLSLDGVELIGAGATAKRMGNTLYIGAGTPDAPTVGDLRISFRALPEGGRATAFAEGLGKELVPYLHKGETRVFRALAGTRAEATKALADEYKAAGFMGYIGGFLLMWIGMTMVFAPLHGVMDILPFAGKISRGLVGCLTFPLAGILAAIAITLSVIAHSPIVLLGLFAALIAGGVFMYKRNKAAAAA